VFHSTFALIDAARLETVEIQAPESLTVQLLHKTKRYGEVILDINAEVALVEITVLWRPKVLDLIRDGAETALPAFESATPLQLHISTYHTVGGQMCSSRIAPKNVVAAPVDT
jgi:hypothetical protein